MARALTLTHVRELNLSVPSAPGRPSHLSAASGLVRAGANLYVVADDELHLGVFDAQGEQAGHLVRLFEGSLPAEPAQRKARKPDLEALTLLPPSASYPHGAIFALGSGSTPGRRRGALLALDPEGGVSGSARACDLSGMFAVLGEHFESPNIEGALVAGDQFCLLQRGNRRVVQNAIVRAPLGAVLAALSRGRPGASWPPLEVQSIDLGHIEGIPLCFTDGAALPGGEIVFTAAAEDAHDSYQDGPCAGAAVGLVAASGHLRWLRRLDPPRKVEGIEARADGDVVRLLLVTDADDAAIPGCLYSAIVEKS